MAKKTKTKIKNITAFDIRRRHPRGLTCETDMQYARLANEILEFYTTEWAWGN